jgi:hypothetical protein
MADEEIEDVTIEKGGEEKEKNRGDSGTIWSYGWK